MKNAELRALISLLDDSDEEVFAHVRATLLSEGEAVIPELEKMWEFDHFEPLFQDRVLDILHQIQLNTVHEGLLSWSKDDANLLQGFYLLNKYHYPDKDKSHLEKIIDRISKSIWLELNNNLTAFEIVGVFNHVIFTEFGFKANKTNYHSPQNSYLGDVLESKKGNPLSLCIVYQLVAERLGIPIKGVNLPNHFILAYLDENNTNTYLDDPEREVLFYINPFSNGSILTYKEIDQFLAQLKIEPEYQYYHPCSNTDMLKRSINNLIYSYARQGYSDKVAELKSLEKALDKR